MRQLFGVIEKMAEATSHHFILKEHPSSGKNYPDLHERAKKLSNVDFANGYPTQELIEGSSTVITINSTVGIESLLFHKKVITLGKAFYSIEGIAHHAPDEDILLNLLKIIDQTVFNEKLVDSFLKYLYYDYLVPKDDNIYEVFAKFITEQ